ncbi:hypothetical protein I603_2363 [Erythrobacter dokdonensis DSW-74]|uniref:Uncharacterized protein n=1 Tax=Erythrobacter dokdonensis DSW-74 TaxID=1300349 RepID=A0A1A7BF79_9SPHN|nr:hypothetical protein I603_2363 [Erythrobacter dokdonensis DSW-74]
MRASSGAICHPGAAGSGANVCAFAMEASLSERLKWAKEYKVM